MSCLADAIAAMFCAWNETDEQRIREHAAQSLTPDIEFTDPGNRVHGAEQWIQMVKVFRAANPEAQPRLASFIDQHNDRARYAWAVKLHDGTKLEGVDVIAFDTDPCRIRRIDSFIGRLAADNYGPGSDLQ